MEGILELLFRKWPESDAKDDAGETRSSRSRLVSAILARTNIPGVFSESDPSASHWRLLDML